jgi:hypothetical protein
MPGTNRQNSKCRKTIPKLRDLISWFFEHPRKITKIENFLLFGTQNTKHKTQNTKLKTPNAKLYSIATG